MVQRKKIIWHTALHKSTTTLHTPFDIINCDLKNHFNWIFFHSLIAHVVYEPLHILTELMTYFQG